ncbi:DUF4142 domain-containing protein [Deinococcus multiflagellatus]|uniref:DUF4142 domain-containing protein n=1 Tax=Deinococcus multiflagellatus TaxID=1656887 RepID=A0ABW1ZTI3_9DEIO
MQLKVSALSGLNAAAFDAAYLQEQVVAHQMTLSLIQNERTAGKDAEVVALANAQAPIIQQHLDQAQALLRSPASPSQP